MGCKFDADWDGIRVNEGDITRRQEGLLRTSRSLDTTRLVDSFHLPPTAMENVALPTFNPVYTLPLPNEIRGDDDDVLV